MDIYYQKYIKYKIKYLKLKELEGAGKGDKSGKKGKGTGEKTEVVEDSELIKYIRENLINFKTLTSTFRKNIEEQKDSVDKNGNLALHIYLQNDGNDEQVIDFIFPSEEKVTQQNKDGDTFLHIAAKKPNSDNLVEFLWMKGGEGAKNIRNKAGHTLLELGKELAAKNKDQYTKLYQMLFELYSGDSEELKELFFGRRSQAKRLAASGFGAVSSKGVGAKTEGESDSDSELQKPAKKRNVGTKEQNTIELNERFEKTPQYFTFGLSPEYKENIMTDIEKGILFETVYITNSSVIVPKNVNILSVKEADFSNPKLKDFVRKGGDAIGYVAKSHQHFKDELPLVLDESMVSQVSTPSVDTSSDSSFM
jgi:hypothetical protein